MLSNEKNFVTSNLFSLTITFTSVNFYTKHSENFQVVKRYKSLLHDNKQQFSLGLGNPFQTWLVLASSTDVEGSPETGTTTLQSLEAG